MHKYLKNQRFQEGNMQRKEDLHIVLESKWGKRTALKKLISIKEGRHALRRHGILLALSSEARRCNHYYRIIDNMRRAIIQVVAQNRVKNNLHYLTLSYSQSSIKRNEKKRIGQNNNTVSKFS